MHKIGEWQSLVNPFFFALEKKVEERSRARRLHDYSGKLFHAANFPLTGGSAI
jgi:hypothetical protein